MTSASTDPVWNATVEALAPFSSIVATLSPDCPVVRVLQGSPWLTHPEDSRQSRRRPSPQIAKLVASSLDSISRIGQVPGGPVEASPDYLFRFVQTIADRSDLPSDKLGRWIGYVDGCIAYRGHDTVCGYLAANAARGRALDTFELSLLLGFVQGYLVAAGRLDVGSERDRTRPIFHRAYRANGLVPPESVDIRS